MDKDELPSGWLLSDYLTLEKATTCIKLVVANVYTERTNITDCNVFVVSTSVTFKRKNIWLIRDVAPVN